VWVAVLYALVGNWVAHRIGKPLVALAKARGLKTLEGFVLSGNHKMLKLARQLGFTLHHDPENLRTVHVVRAL